MMKRFLSTLLMICMLISLFPAVTFADEDLVPTVAEAEEQTTDEETLEEEQPSAGPVEEEKAEEEQVLEEDAPAPAEVNAETEEESAPQLALDESEPEIAQQDAAYSQFDPVDIDETHFPDATFRAYVMSLDTTAPIGKLSPSEVEAVVVSPATLKSAGIKNLKGIEYFYNLEELDVSDNELTALDLRENTQLKKLNCSKNSLTDIDIRGCSLLQELICDQNPSLSEVYIEECPLLEDAVHAVKPALAGTVMSCISGTKKLQYDEGTRLSHMAEWDDGEVITAANCYTDGVMKYTCKHCTRTKNEAIPATGDHILEENVTLRVDAGPGAPGSATFECTTPGCPYSEVHVLHATDLVGVEINTANFSDPAFRAYVKATYDANGDDFLETATELNTTNMDIHGLGIKRLRGIEHFTKLTTLNCSENEIICGGDSTDKLDLSKNTELTLLICNDNQLTALDVSKCTKLTELRCFNNAITKLDLSKNTALITLSCYDNALTSLNLNGNTKLVTVDCYRNKISSMSLSKCTLLENLDCHSNKLTALDITKNTKLNLVDVSGNSITALTVSSCPKLHKVVHQAEKTSADGVDTYSAGGTTFIVNSSVSITHLPSWKKTVKVKADCKTKTDGLIEYTCTVSGCTEKKNEVVPYADAHKYEKKEVTVEPDETHPGKQLMECSICGDKYEVDIPALQEGIAVTPENFPDENFFNYVKNTLDGDKSLKLTETEINAVTNLDLSGKNIESLKGIEHFTKLTELNVKNNKLTALDLSKNTELTTLNCSGNKLTTLDLTKNEKLTTLSCEGNQLTTLNVSKCIALTKLFCQSNKIAALDLSRLLALQLLGCDDNKLTSLDVSANTALQALDCSYNPLTTLKLGTNTALAKVNCHDCPLTALDISGCSNLKALDVIGAKFKEIELGQTPTLAYTYKNGTENKVSTDLACCAPIRKQKDLPTGPGRPFRRNGAGRRPDAGGALQRRAGHGNVQRAGSGYRRRGRHGGSLCPGDPHHDRYLQCGRGRRQGEQGSRLRRPGDPDQPRPLRRARYCRPG